VKYSLKLWNDYFILSTSTVVASITGAAMLVATIMCSAVGWRLFDRVDLAIEAWG
jgi:hypothetical protein